MDGTTERIHATAISAGGRAVLIRGPSGCGKSDLALRCIATVPSVLSPHPVALVADDQVILTRKSGRLIASAPSQIYGKLEVRGLGIVSIQAVAEAEVVLAAEIESSQRIERLPDDGLSTELIGCRIPLMRLAFFEASAPLKLLMALAGFGMFPKNS